MKNVPLFFRANAFCGITFPLVTIPHADRIGECLRVSWKYAAQDLLADICGTEPDRGFHIAFLVGSGGDFSDSPCVVVDRVSVGLVLNQRNSHIPPHHWLPPT